ncbi:MAG TPA: PH domain-containing protein [Candidatus Tectomicrobia bacterium]|nr:PH domain-containing protein [Candidatus Tectomicrobia bacterium]
MTIGAVLVGVVALTVLGIAVAVDRGDPRWMFLGLPFSIVLFVAGRYAPVAYRLEADGVHVERRAGDAVIPYGAIREADRAPRQVRGMTVLGSRGVFGTFGRFWNAALGLYRLHLSNTDGVVWLRTPGGWIGLSPDRPDEFLERLRRRLASPRSGPLLG